MIPFTVKLLESRKTLAALATACPFTFPSLFPRLLLLLSPPDHFPALIHASGSFQVVAEVPLPLPPFAHLVHLKLGQACIRPVFHVQAHTSLLLSSENDLSIILSRTLTWRWHVEMTKVSVFITFPYLKVRT